MWLAILIPGLRMGGGQAEVVLTGQEFCLDAFNSKVITLDAFDSKVLDLIATNENCNS